MLSQTRKRKPHELDEGIFEAYKEPGSFAMRSIDLLIPVLYTYMEYANEH